MLHACLNKKFVLCASFSNVLTSNDEWSIITPKGGSENNRR